VRRLLPISLLVLLAASGARAQCDGSLWKHVYKPKRLLVKQACVVATGTIVDATNGKRKDACRHEADGDGHCFLKLDAGQENFLNQKNLDNEDGNLVVEPICIYRVTQQDAIAACKNFTQHLKWPHPGMHVKITGSFVTDLQHGHNELHPVSIVEIIP